MEIPNDYQQLVRHKCKNKPEPTDQKSITVKLTPFKLQVVEYSNTYPAVIFPWYHAIYGTFTNVQLVYYVEVFDTNFDLLVYADNIVINSDLNISVTGFRTLTLSLPNNDFILKIFAIRKVGTMDPCVHNINLQYS